MWDARVNVFMHVLALHEVREALGVYEAQVAAPEPAGAAPAGKRRPRPNVLQLHDVVLVTEEQDVLTLDDDRRD